MIRRRFDLLMLRAVGVMAALGVVSVLAVAAAVVERGPSW